MQFRKRHFICFVTVCILGGCANQPQTAPFRMPDGREAAFVTLPGNGATPPVVAVLTPKASPFDVRVVSSTPLAQSVLSGALAGAEIGGGLAAEGALIRPARVTTNAGATANTTSQALVTQ